ncbi:MAG: zf-HC2 domain-containing protein, partial [Acidimicrobiales bacterium]
QAHVRNHARRECLFTVEHLGAYVGGGLSARDLAKVDQHLAGCKDCRERLTEIEDLGTTLRRAMVPVPLALGAAAGAWRLKLGLAATSTAPGARAGRRAVGQAASRAHWALGGAAAGLVAAGLYGALSTGGSTHLRSGKSAPQAAESHLATPAGSSIAPPTSMPAAAPSPAVAQPAVAQPALALAVSSSLDRAPAPPPPPHRAPTAPTP